MSVTLGLGSERLLGTSGKEVEDGSGDQIERKKRAPQATTNSGAHTAGTVGRTVHSHHQQ